MLHKIALINENCVFLQRGIDLIEQISNDLYANNSSQFFMSGVGKHFRHVIDHYQSLLNGIDTVVNYDNRERNSLIESNKDHAVQIMKEIIVSLKNLQELTNKNDLKLTVICNEGEVETEDSSLSDSSLTRELQFLISHTVHHYAVIAIILRVQGFEPPVDFGIAPSTIAYLRSLQMNEMKVK